MCIRDSWEVPGTPVVADGRCLHAQSFSAAAHISRMLGGGVHGPAGLRSAAQRASMPRRCCCCGADQ
eukprot:7498723-Alexandrium_andersonii.AAC.1